MKRLAYEQLTKLEQSHWWFRGRRTVYRRLLEDVLGDAPVRRTLDVGAGVGGFLAELQPLSRRLFFTELDAHGARMASERGLASGVRSRVESMPFRNGCLDLVSLFDVLEHVREDGRALAEATRVLAPGGKLILSVPAHPWLFSRNDEVAGHFRRYTRRELIGLLRASGLTILRCTYVNSALFAPIASALLVSKLGERWLAPLRENEHTNLSWRFPRALHEVCYRLFCSELWLSRRWDLPLGHSLLAIAEKQTVASTPLVLAPSARRSPVQRPIALRTVPG